MSGSRGSEPGPKAEADDALALNGELTAFLNRINSAGDFAVLDCHPSFINPGIQINGHTISLPLAQGDAEVIKAVSRQAPFGKGDQTLVDTSVRNTWELDHSMFKTVNPKWELGFARIVRRAADGLGLLDMMARPHKMLLYEEGSFFTRHKDSEKEPGMVGTLVICLPTPHEGGEVHLSFRSEKRTFATSPTSAWDMTALAWFSDVTHEIAKVTKGYRLVLTYNLIQTGSVKQSAQFFQVQSENLRAILVDWETRVRDIHNVLYILDHQYTESSLSLDNLKGRDRAVCQALRETCSNSGLFLFVGHITLVNRGDKLDYRDYRESFYTANTLCCLDGKVVGKNGKLTQPHTLNAVKRSPDSEIGPVVLGNEEAPPESRYHDSAALLVPKRFLWKHLGYCTLPSHSENMAVLVDEDLRSHPDMNAKSAAVIFFEKVLAVTEETTALTVHIATRWALELGEDKLYGIASTRASRGLPALESFVRAVGNHLETNVRGSDQAKALSWHSWFDGLEKTCSLESWHFVVGKFPTLLKSEDLKVSFEGWAQSRLDVKLASQPKLRSADHDFLITFLESHRADTDWIMNAFLPGLASRGDRDLMFKISDTLFQKWKQEQLPIAKTAFEYMHEHAASQLLIHAADLELRYGNRGTEGPCREFVTFLGQSLAMGCGEHAARLLEATEQNFLHSQTSWDIGRMGTRVLVSELMRPLASILESHKLSTSSSARGVFVVILRHALYPKIGDRPEKLAGWAYRPHECDDKQSGYECKMCDLLNKFLVSEDTRTWEFDGIDMMLHIKEILPRKLVNLVRLEKGRFSLEKPGKEWEREMKKHESAVKKMRQKLEGLQGPFMEELLGDECYRELILLETQEVEEPEEALVIGTQATQTETD